MKSIKEEIIEKLLDAKLLTAGGGILLAGLLGWLYYKTVTNHLEHVQDTYKDFSQVINNSQVQQTEALGGVREALIGNTKVLEILERRLQ